MESKNKRGRQRGKGNEMSSRMEGEGDRPPPPPPPFPTATSAVSPPSMRVSDRPPVGPPATGGGSTSAARGRKASTGGREGGEGADGSWNVPLWKILSWGAAADVEPKSDSQSTLKRGSLHDGTFLFFELCVLKNKNIIF